MWDPRLWGVQLVALLMQLQTLVDRRHLIIMSIDKNAQSHHSLISGRQLHETSSRQDGHSTDHLHQYVE